MLRNAMPPGMSGKGMAAKLTTAATAHEEHHDTTENGQHVLHDTPLAAFETANRFRAASSR